MSGSVAKAHRLLAPRIAYLIGTRDHGGTPNVIPVSNVTSVSTDPQHVLLAVYKQWRTYETLLNAKDSHSPYHLSATCKACGS